METWFVWETTITRINNVKLEMNLFVDVEHSAKNQTCTNIGAQPNRKYAFIEYILNKVSNRSLLIGKLPAKVAVVPRLSIIAYKKITNLTPICMKAIIPFKNYNHQS
jgi:hypothetical protein